MIRGPRTAPGDNSPLGVPIKMRQKEGPERSIRMLLAPMTKRRLLWLKNWN